MRAIGASLAGLALSIALPAHAQTELETRMAEDDAVSPAASADQLDWLVGSWTGPGVRDQTAMETWTAPIEGTMVGTFIQQDADDTIWFTELMHIRPVGDSLEIAIKHFNPDLTSWEEKDEVERFPLIEIEDCAAYFKGLTIRCADKGARGEGIVVAVRAGTDETGNVKELVFRYSPGSIIVPRADDCAGTTRQINACLTQLARQAEKRRKHYLMRALARFSDNDEMLGHMVEADELFLDYVTGECDRGMWSKSGGDATYGALMARCRIALLDARTHHIWRNWLTFDDGAPPLLPEPGLISLSKTGR